MLLFIRNGISNRPLYINIAQVLKLRSETPAKHEKGVEICAAIFDYQAILEKHHIRILSLIPVGFRLQRTPRVLSPAASPSFRVQLNATARHMSR